MEQTFSLDDARRLAQSCRDLSAGLNAVIDLPVTYRAAIQSQADALADGGELTSLAERDLISGAKGTALSDFRTLLVTLYAYRLALPAADECHAVQDRHAAEIDRDLRTLSGIDSRLKWLFSGSEKKAAWADACARLSALLRGGYAAEAAKAVAGVRTISDVTFDEAAAALDREPAAFADALRACLADNLHPAATLPAIDALTGQYAAQQARLASLRETVDTARNNVRAAAQQLAAEKALDALEAIPVEELNRDKNGIRVKLLRDGGFNTIADVYTAAEHELASIRGISEDAAHRIREIARGYALSARMGLKLRLTADDRSPAAEALVSRLYRYRTIHAAESALTAVEAGYGADIAAALAALAAVNDSRFWFFRSEADRQSARDAYRKLSSLSAADGDAQIRPIEDKLRAALPSDDDIWDDFTRNAAQYIVLLEEASPDLFRGGDMTYGLPDELAQNVRDEALYPDGLKCTLRRYQEWGVKYILHQEKVLLGDEMGLGKTVQAIAAMVSLRNGGQTHFVVVCPASVLANWCREIPQHSTLRVTQVYGENRERERTEWLETGGVAVTTYETTEHFALEEDFRFSMLVVDEAHYIKNPNTKRSKNVTALCAHADRLLFMTGTALENKVDEMIALIRILRPDIARQLRMVSYLSGAPQFREKIAPVYYRRRREDVLTELPELIESREWCRMTPEEEKIYEDCVRKKLYAESRRVSWNAPDLEQSSKARRMRELIDAAEDDGRKVLIFTFFLETAQRVRELLGDRCLEPINGSVPPQRRQEIVDEFEAAPAGSVLLAQIQAGGTGLNIQSASVVILCEPQFKPSTENQAISRAYRMGQARSVLVHRLLCEDSVDERIVERLERKQDIFDAFADTSAAAEEDLALDDKTFGSILQEELDRINAKYDPPL